MLMKWTIGTIILLFSISCHAGDDSFSGWMAKRDLDSYFEILNKGDTSSNYFDKGHWISAVEGRWNGHEVEYRVIIEDTPDVPFKWWWWFNQKHRNFVAIMKKYEKEGASLIRAQSFAMPDGTVLYQSVWTRYPEGK
jgi:hypothetical protein